MTTARLAPAGLAAVVAALGLTSVHAALSAPEFSPAGGSTALLALGVAAGWAVAGAGLALDRMRSNPAGRLLVLAGFAWLASGLATPGARAAPLFTLGLALSAAAPAFVGDAMLAEAGDGLRRAGQVVRVVLYLTLLGLLGILPTLVDDPRVNGCAACPTNLLRLTDAPNAAATLSRWGLPLGVAALTACVAIVFWRLISGSPARRRWTTPLVAPGCAFLLASAIGLAHAWRRGAVGVDATDRTLWMMQAATLLAVAAGVALYLVALRRRRTRLTGLVLELATAPGTGGLRDALARLLGDAELELLYADEGVWIDTEGTNRAPRPGSVQTPLVREGARIALLCHRRGVLDDPAAVRELERAVRLGLDYERLQAQMRRQLARLRRSRADVSTAAESERRGLERDLHDGAQHRLAAFAFALGLARRRVDAPLAARLERAQREVALALDELRDLAHGLYPIALADAGLAAALESLSDRRPGLQVTDSTKERFAPAVEEAAYFAVLRIADQWHPHPLGVVAHREDRRLLIDMRAAVAVPGDLVALEDRLSALDGTIAVHGGEPDSLSRVRVELPCG